jgi:hypothetical protein
MATSKPNVSPAEPKLLLVSPTETPGTGAVYSYSPSAPRDDLLFTIDNDCARHSFVEVVTPSPCCGLTLLFDKVARAYYVCNAATRAVIRLPPYRDPGHVSSAGLGFDAQSKEYKVVRLINGYTYENEMLR